MLFWKHLFVSKNYSWFRFRQLFGKIGLLSVATSDHAGDRRPFIFLKTNKSWEKNLENLSLSWEAHKHYQIKFDDQTTNRLKMELPKMDPLTKMKLYLVSFPIPLLLSEQKNMDLKMGTWMDLNVWSENTHLRSKYHCTADLLFDWFRFEQSSKAAAN